MEHWRLRHSVSTGKTYSMEEVGPMTFEYREVDEYAQFLARKTQSGADSGFAPVWMPDFLHPFQAAITEWAIRKGRGAILADCGLGKTPMQLVWAENVVRKTNRPVLILTPLAVAQQTIREAEKFRVEAVRGSTDKPVISVTNYEKLHLMRPDGFAGVVCDESSILKSFNGARRSEITAFMRHVPYRLLCTATAAPNDYVELGTSSEALGELGQMDMLGRFFVNDQNNSATGRNWGSASKWRFKGHAEVPFWRWVCSWARAVRKPSDLGFDDSGFNLPRLIEREHIVETRTKAPGMLFSLPAANMQEEREERRRTIEERCEMAADLVRGTGTPSVLWCHLNDEGDLLERLIPGSVQVSGKDCDEKKEEAYQSFASGQIKDLITKPKIGAFGLNWQHCPHVVSFASHSYEQYYQSVRRCWRFGQKREVVVDLVVTEGEQGIKENLRRKSAAADAMFSELVAHMNDAMGVARGAKYSTQVEAPAWL